MHNMHTEILRLDESGDLMYNMHAEILGFDERRENLMHNMRTVIHD